MSNNKWTKEQLEKAGKLAQAMMTEAEEGVPKEQNLKDSLVRRVEGGNPDNVIANLQEGIRIFHNTFNQAQSRGITSLLDSKFDEMLSGYDEEEQKTLMKDIFEGCVEASGQEISEDLETPESLEELKEAVKEYIVEYSVLNLDCEAAARILQEIGADSIKELQDAEELSRKEAYTALAVYILMATGELTDIPAGITAKEIGVYTAASYCEQKTILEAIHGKINWDEVKSLLKLIAGCAVIAIVTIVAVKAAFVAGVVAAVVTESIIGLGIIGTLVAFVFTYGIIDSIVQTTLPVIMKVGEVTGINEKANAVWAKISEWFNNTVRPAFASFKEKVLIKLENAINPAESMEEVVCVQNTQEENAPANA